MLASAPATLDRVVHVLRHELQLSRDQALDALAEALGTLLATIADPETRERRTIGLTQRVKRLACAGDPPAPGARLTRSGG
jgi:hypothetical protein